MPWVYGFLLFTLIHEIGRLDSFVCVCKLASCVTARVCTYLALSKLPADGEIENVQFHLQKLKLSPRYLHFPFRLL